MVWVSNLALCVYISVLPSSALCWQASVGLWTHQYGAGRWLAYSGWTVAAGWGLKIAHDQVLVEQTVREGGFSTCGYLCRVPDLVATGQLVPCRFQTNRYLRRSRLAIYGAFDAFLDAVDFCQLFINGVAGDGESTEKT